MTAPEPRRNRRVQRAAAVGVDPRPSEHPLDDAAGEDRTEAWGDGSAGDGGTGERAREEQLRRDKPPHWG